MDLKVIPKSLPWLIVVEGVITSAHKAPCYAQTVIAGLPTVPKARVLEQSDGVGYYIGQRVVSVSGKAVPV